MSTLENFAMISLLSFLLLMVLQLGTFVLSRRIHRNNVVDVAWGPGFVVVALISAVLGEGPFGRRLLLLTFVTVWAARLSWYLYRRTAGQGEDPRYAEVLHTHGYTTFVVLRRIFLIQGAAQWVVSLPIQLTATAGPTTGTAWLAVILGALAWLVGLVFEAAGDGQLRRFRSDPGNRGLIMDRGLWAWTRHPNYFGDFCVWWGIWLVAASAWPVPVTIGSPIVMSYILIRGTGARLLERTLQHRPGYADYQRRTAFFFPAPPRRQL